MFSGHVYCRCYFFGLASQLARIAVSTNLRDLGNENGKADKHTDKLAKECKDESLPGSLGNVVSIVRMIVSLYLEMLCLLFEVLGFILDLLLVFPMQREEYGVGPPVDSRVRIVVL